MNGSDAVRGRREHAPVLDVFVILFPTFPDYLSLSQWPAVLDGHSQTYTKRDYLLMSLTSGMVTHQNTPAASWRVWPLVPLEYFGIPEVFYLFTLRSKTVHLIKICDELPLNANYILNRPWICTCNNHN